MNTNISITIRYGSGNTLTRTFGTPITVNQVLADRTIKGALGYGDNVEGRLNGIPQPGTNNLVNGDVLEVFDKACSKGAATSVAG